MNELQLFSNPEFGEIRTVEIDGEGWFVGSDVAKALGYANARNAVARNVDEDDARVTGITDSLGREQQTKIINESGLYALIIMSELPSAKKFKRWITSEVLPSIRKHGGYGLTAATPNELIAMLAQNNVELERKVNSLQGNVQQITGRLDNAIQVFAAPPSKDNWKEEMTDRINAIVLAHGLSHSAFRGQLYAELEENGVNLNSRVSRLRTRMEKQGATYKERQAVTKLEVISRDRQLRPIFEAIVKRYTAIYSA